MHSSPSQGSWQVSSRLANFLCCWRRLFLISQPDCTTFRTLLFIRSVNWFLRRSRHPKEASRGTSTCVLALPHGNVGTPFVSYSWWIPFPTPLQNQISTSTWICTFTLRFLWFFLLVTKRHHFPLSKQVFLLRSFLTACSSTAWLSDLE